MRLVTRSDFDGLASGALLLALGIIDDWQFVHPKDLQDGKFLVTQDDILANVPYVPGCGMWFDHHASEFSRVGRDKLVAGDCRPALSAARVIYEYYDGAEKLPHFAGMIDRVDSVDSGQLSREDIMHPKGWVLLGFLMDPRTGLGRFRNFRISNYELMLQLLHACATKDIDEILAMPDVHERVALYHEQAELFKQMIWSHTRIEGNVIITDLRGVDPIHAGNRFLVYSLYPEQNVSLWIVDGRGKQNCPIAVGYSILNRSCVSDIGSMMLRFGGGGHKQVGTCQVPYAEADHVIRDIVNELVADDAKRAKK